MGLSCHIKKTKTNMSIYSTRWSGGRVVRANAKGLAHDQMQTEGSLDVKNQKAIYGDTK